MLLYELVKIQPQTTRKPYQYRHCCGDGLSQDSAFSASLRTWAYISTNPHKNVEHNCWLVVQALEKRRKEGLWGSLVSQPRRETVSYKARWKVLLHHAALPRVQPVGAAPPNSRLLAGRLWSLVFIANKCGTQYRPKCRCLTSLMNLKAVKIHSKTLLPGGSQDKREKNRLSLKSIAGQRNSNESQFEEKEFSMTCLCHHIWKTMKRHKGSLWYLSKDTSFLIWNWREAKSAQTFDQFSPVPSVDPA